jgi:hypothetical protein
MTRRSAQRNIESLSLIAHRLGDLCDEVTFVGGSITGLRNDGCFYSLEFPLLYLCSYWQMALNK